MPLPPQPGIAWRLAALAAVLCLAGCAAPLGPGYRIEHQELSVEYVSGAQPALRVRAVWHVENTGYQPLGGVEASLPDPQSHDLRDVRAGLNGDALEPAPADGSVRIAFDPPLSIGESREIAVTYELHGARSEFAGTDVTPQGFILAAGDWAPVLLRPKHAFSRGGEAPMSWEMNIRVPAGWRVHASGRPRGSERGEQEQTASVTCRFAQRRREDSLPFAVGGAFHEAAFKAGGNEVVFWTREPLPASLGQRAAEAAAGTVQFYEGVFGPRKNATRRWWIIECPRKNPCWPLAETAMVGAEIQREDSWSAVLSELERQLAYSWLDFRVHPDWEKEPLPMGVLAEYAGELAAAAREGGQARQKLVHGLVETFDDYKARQPEPPVFSVLLSDPVPARQFAGVKSELFFFALEDAVGRENLLRALRHLLKTYQGGTWRADDLRSAAEQESGKNLAPLFHRWLVDPGIPGDFRSLY
jgi:hypothetical protein